MIIISASATDLVEPIARELGVDRTVGSQLGIKDGKYTGEVLFYCKGPAKAEAINALAKERNYDLSKSFAYSDSATDLPMLEAVGHAVAVNPDRALKKEALARGWDIRSFKNPEPLFKLGTWALAQAWSRALPPSPWAGGGLPAEESPVQLKQHALSPRPLQLQLPRRAAGNRIFRIVLVAV